MFVEQLRRTVASTGGTLLEVSTRATQTEPICHGCGKCGEKAPRRSAGITVTVGLVLCNGICIPPFWPPIWIQDILTLSCPVLYWESAEARLRAAWEVIVQRAKEGQILPRSLGVPSAGARLPQS